MRKKYIIVLLGLMLISLISLTPAFAVPTLQLYMPGATYYNTNPVIPSSEDSWVTTSNPLELWVVGATSPQWVNYISNVKLYVALLEDEYSASFTEPIMTIKDNDPNIDFEKVLYADDFSFGKPPGISKHGIYKTYYASVSLPNLLVNSAGETVYDYTNLSDSDTGDIQYYDVTLNSQFSFAHFDLTGKAKGNGNCQFVFAPYSHDAEVNSVPEPATISLFGLGILGMFGFKKKGRKK